MKYCMAIFICLIPLLVTAQQKASVQILQNGIQSSFRGLSAPTDEVVWVSGSNGTVGRSTDGGISWKWITIPGFEKRDFRDIEAFDSTTAVIMAVDNPADILKTTDGGKNWKVVFHKQQEGIFLDDMAFQGNDGIAIGDPLPTSPGIHQFFMVYTTNQGDSWLEIPNTVIAQTGEAIFAASGNNFFFSHHRKNKGSFITGGSVSNLHLLSHRLSYTVKNIPIMQGKPSAGAFSMCTDGNKSFYITGGDYTEYWKDSGNVVYTRNLGKTWKRTAVHGYRSCIIQAGKKTFIACGTNGVDMSVDGCRSFQLIYGDGAKGTDGFNVCAKSKIGTAVYFAGNKTIGKLIR